MSKGYTPAALEAARNLAARLAEDMRQHAKVCRTCVSLTQNANRYCDEGWQLTKRYHQARQQADRLEAESAVPAPVLF